MRERLYYTCLGNDKKEILEALKNEQKYNKKINIYDKNDEAFVKILKWDSYSEYIDFWLDNFIGDFMLVEAGKIQTIELYDFTTKKGQVVKRIKKITA